MDSNVYCNFIPDRFIDKLSEVGYKFDNICTGYVMVGDGGYPEYGVKVPKISEVLDFYISHGVYISTDAYYDQSLNEVAITYSVLFNTPKVVTHIESSTTYSELYYALIEAIEFTTNYLLDHGQKFTFEQARECSASSSH